MKWRIGLWILAGFAVGCIWLIVGIVIPRGVDFNFGIWTITAPVTVSRAIHIPVRFYEFIAMNAALYGLIGLALEPFLRITSHRLSLPRA